MREEETPENSVVLTPLANIFQINKLQNNVLF